MMTALTKWKLGLSLAAIFCAGGVSGWMVATKTAREKMLTPPRGDEMASSFRNQLHSKLSLTADQTKQIDAIIERSSKERESLQGECFRRIRQGMSNRNAQISALLSPDQQKQFEEIEKQRQAAWRSKDQWRGKGTGRDRQRHASDTNSARPLRDRARPNTATNSSAPAL